MALVACGPTGDGSGNGNGDGDGNGNGNGNPDAASNDPNSPDARQVNEFVDAAADGGCGLQEEEIGLVELGDPPDLLIVLDRSNSMTTAVNILDIFGPNRWQAMGAALKDVVMNTENNIRWGLSVFPTDNDCGVSAGTQDPIDLTNYSDIASWLDSNSPGGNTPAHLGLEDALATYNSIPINPAGRYVLFATDGVPNCDETDNNADGKTLAAVTALANAGIHTYVIGFGDPLGLDSQLLNDAATEGQTARPGGPPYYYEASNQADLQTALDQISGGVIVPTCEYALDSVPPDPDAVTVKVNGMPVPRSTNHTNGWDYHPDASTITFFGSYCDQIESGAVTGVEFFFGCPGPVID